jgi:hypothetical protein
MTLKELTTALLKVAKNKDLERAHQEADYLLITYINDKAVTAAYDKVGKWYA